MNTNNSGDYLKNGNTTFDTSSSNSMKAIVNGNRSLIRKMVLGIQSNYKYKINQLRITQD